MASSSGTDPDSPEDPRPPPEPSGEPQQASRHDKRGLRRWKVIFQKDRTEILTAWITAFVLLVGSVVALQQYLSSRKELKVQRALDYLAKFSTPELVNARIQLSKKEDENVELLQEIVLPGQRDQDEINVAYSNFVRNQLIGHGAPEGREELFYRLLYFQEEGVICTRQKLCDETTIRAGLNDFGRGFFRTYAPYLCYLRRRWNDPSIGRSAEEFYNPASLTKDICKTYSDSFEVVQKRRSP